MSSRRVDSSGPELPLGSKDESFAGPMPVPPADALEAAAARARRVEEVRRAVAAGTYRPDARKVAESVLRSETRRSLFGDDH